MRYQLINFNEEDDKFIGFLNNNNKKGKVVFYNNFIDESKSNKL